MTGGLRESFALCHSEESFALCHSEGAERPKNLAQDKLRDWIIYVIMDEKNR